MSTEQDLRNEIVDVVDELFAMDMITSTGGNVSARIPDEEDAFLITPTRLHKGGLTPELIVKVKSTGKSYDRRQRPSVETKVHLAIYAAYPDIEAAIHSHAKMCTVLGLINGSVPPICVEAVTFSDTQIVPYGLPGTPELCQNVVEALQHSPAVLLQNHGLLTVGWTVRHAANHAMALERIVQMMLACKLFGKEPANIPPETVDLVKSLGAI